jgi:hypothetical protein
MKISKAKRRHLTTCMDFAASNAEYERDLAVQKAYSRALTIAAPYLIAVAQKARERRAR